ncbi:MAG: TdeIII family type II restriction endonuclease [Candidatus Cloacimonetes bacterium]|jgi:hypothetical protein|nr:TdeIII family type II restriction endonuclease [Candidatus Cloacimonadota bacterium]MDD4231140.1 TdeIII family type II restriction endonuclease [Candidatus Cloacimonadota bacterium]MDY0298334.1 TdeIII family type II restriction endonuclease [Candidatus Cloacimonadaceae bacterium]
MTLPNDVNQSISIAVIEILKSRFDKFPSDYTTNRNAPFHEAFLSAFRDKMAVSKTDPTLLVSLSSWLHGLNTTLGQSFFERVANILCGGEKKEWTSKKDGNLQISHKQKEIINTICTELSNSSCVPCKNREEKLINEASGGELVNALDFSADVLFVDEDETINAIELKSVKPNSGELRGEKQKILEGRTALNHLYKGKRVNFFIGFPFDPTVTEEEDACSYNKNRFLSKIIGGDKFFDSDEILIASELWDYLSGQPNTMQSIIELINNIATTEFERKFEQLYRYEFPSFDAKMHLLEEWKLYDELKIQKNNAKLRKQCANFRREMNYLDQGCFDSKGKYKTERVKTLLARIGE